MSIPTPVDESRGQEVSAPRMMTSSLHVVSPAGPASEVCPGINQDQQAPLEVELLMPLLETVATA